VHYIVTTDNSCDVILLSSSDVFKHGYL